jgi:hypothetical protein
MIGDELLPDEELPRRLDAAEEVLATSQHRWFARATVLATLATGFTLLLPWTFSRRLGLSVWQLGIEVQPSLALTWLAGLITSIVALSLPAGLKAQAASAATGVLALLFVAGGWQAKDLQSISDTWAGPGPAFAIVTGLIWLLCATAQLLADRTRPATPDDKAVADAIARLRTNR